MQLKVHKIENFFDSDFGICTISLLVVRQLLQSATPPHWGTSPIVVRAIPGYTRRRVPTGYQTGSNSVLRAAILFNYRHRLTKMHKAVEAWKQKKIHK